MTDAIVLTKLGVDLINASIGIVAMLRRQGWTNEDINARFDAIDAGGPGITQAELQAKYDAWQAHLKAAEQIQ